MITLFTNFVDGGGGSMGRGGASAPPSLSKNALKLVYWFKEFATLTPLIKNKKKVATLPP